MTFGYSLPCSIEIGRFKFHSLLKLLFSQLLLHIFFDVFKFSTLLLLFFAFIGSIAFPSFLFLLIIVFMVSVIDVFTFKAGAVLAAGYPTFKA